MSKAKELVNLTVDELNNKLAELKHNLLKLNAQRSTAANLQNPMEIRNTKKGIARILTVMNNKKNN